MSQRSKQLIARILVLVFAVYYANICFFYHSHVINGATIVHSHLHDKAHAQTGSHGESEITLISALSLFQSLQAAFTAISIGLFLILLAVVLPLHERRNACSFLTSNPLRAPPVLF